MLTFWRFSEQVKRNLVSYWHFDNRLGAEYIGSLHFRWEILINGQEYTCLRPNQKLGKTECIHEVKQETLQSSSLVSVYCCSLFAAYFHDVRIFSALINPEHGVFILLPRYWAIMFLIPLAGGCECFVLLLEDDCIFKASAIILAKAEAGISLSNMLIPCFPVMLLYVHCES